MCALVYDSTSKCLLAIKNTPSGLMNCELLSSNDVNTSIPASGFIRYGPFLYEKTAELSLHISVSKRDIEKRFREVLDKLSYIFRTLKLFAISVHCHRILTLVKFVV